MWSKLKFVDLGSELNHRFSETCKSRIFKVTLETMETISRIEIEKFNGHNFELWKLKIEDLLVDREQWELFCLGTILKAMLSE